MNVIYENNEIEKENLGVDTKISDENCENRTPIQNFYANQNIFITGGTGYLGSLLVEKLLRSCPDISKIYLLIRHQVRNDTKSRLENLLDRPIFDNLREKGVNFKGKIEVINGDFTIDGLNISNEDRKILIRNVSIVFHTAATLNFKEKLNLATAINAKGCLDILELCKSMKNLKALIHVSTISLHMYRIDLEERFYDHLYTYDQLLKIIENIPDERLNEITSSLIKPWGNTYVFTKAMAEEIIRRNNSSIPVGIFRPAMVLSTYKEPIRGWINNYYGPTGFSARVMSGISRVINMNPNNIAEFIPGDYTINALISSAWDIARNKNMQDERNKDILIYNYVSSPESKITVGQFFKEVEKYGSIYTPKNAIRHCKPYLSSNSLIRTIYAIIHEWFPDKYLRLFLIFSETKSIKLWENHKIVTKKVNEVVKAFPNDVEVTNKNVQEMWARLDKTDKKIFFFSMKNFNWSDYMDYYVQGIRIYMMKDKMDTLHFSKIKLNRMYRRLQWSMTVIVLLFLAIFIGIILFMKI